MDMNNTQEAVSVLAAYLVSVKGEAPSIYQAAKEAQALAQHDAERIRKLTRAVIEAKTIVYNMGIGKERRSEREIQSLFDEALLDNRAMDFIKT
jgi:hypothetical protein